LALDALHEENIKLQQRLLSSRELSVELEHALDNSITTARNDHQAMTGERTTLNEEIQVISNKLNTQRAENQRLRDEADQVSQILTALKGEQRETEAAYTQTDTRLLETTSALRSISEENNKLRHELARSENTTANLRQQLDQSEASIASLEMGNALSELRPVPTAGNPKPVYPRMAIRRGIEGDVGLSVNVSSAGQVSKVSVSKPSGFAILDQAAIDSVKKWEFTPATRDGVPTAMVIDIPVQFRLIDSRG
jgi:TonB family protein